MGIQDFLKSSLKWLTKMLLESMRYERLKSHLHPFSLQRSKCQKTIKLNYLNFYRRENYKPGMMSVLSKGTASRNSQPSASPMTSWCQTKTKSVRRDLYTWEEKYDEKMCEPQKMSYWWIPTECGHSPRLLTDPPTSMCESKKLHFCSSNTRRETWSMKDTDHWMLPMKENSS